MYYEEVESRNVWMSAYLLLYGCEIVRVVPIGPRKSRFYHRNENHRANDLVAEWRSESDANVNAPAFMRAYHLVMNRARQAEMEDEQFSEDSQYGYSREHGRSVTRE